MAKFRKLFTPFKIKNLALKNRVVMPPMCQYSATDGMPNDWHFVHYTSRAVGDVGLIIVEMTNVAANGRITPNCLGLWNDEQRDAFKRIVDGVHAQGGKIAVQIGHAGRKAQNEPNAVAPSAIHYGELDYAGQSLITPRELSTTEVKELVQAFQNSVKRAVEAGFDSDYGVEVAKRFAAAGADVLDVSGGGDGVLHAGNHPEFYAGYQVYLAEKVKQATGLPVIAVGMLDDPAVADHVLGIENADLVAVGRALLREPYWVLNAQYRQNATDDSEIQFVPKQYERGFA